MTSLENCLILHNGGLLSYGCYLKSYDKLNTSHFLFSYGESKTYSVTTLS